MEFLWPIIILASLGIIFGALIAVLSKVLYVEEDHRIEEVEKMLPGYNCGGCGKSGCHALATAIIEEGASPEYCKPIKKEQIEVIKEFLKKALEENK
ncbi:MAG: electron transporter RnfB [Bacilli bacterium]|nr:electron transporter RnfB [Bacilli bacterium]